jgi:hypothetical protein
VAGSTEEISASSALGSASLEQSGSRGKSGEFRTSAEPPESARLKSAVFASDDHIRSVGLAESGSGGESGQIGISADVPRSAVFKSAAFESAGFDSDKQIRSVGLAESGSGGESGQIGISADVPRSAVFKSAAFESAGFDSDKHIESADLEKSGTPRRSGQVGSSADLTGSAGFESAAFDSADLDHSHAAEGSGQFGTSAELTESTEAPGGSKTLGDSAIPQSFMFQESFLLNQTDDWSISFEFPESGSFTPPTPSPDFSISESLNVIAPASGDAGGKGGSQTLIAAVGATGGAVVLSGAIPLIMKLVRRKADAPSPKSEYSFGDSEDVDFSDAW